MSDPVARFLQDHGGGTAVAQPDPVAEFLKQHTDTGNVDISSQPDPVAEFMKQPVGGLVPEKKSIRDAIWEGLKEQGRELVQFGSYALTGPMLGGPNPLSGKLVVKDIALAQAGDAEAQKRLNRGLRGGALVASTVISGGASAALKAGAGVVAPTLTRRALTFAASEALGGSTFGAIAPLEGDETRTQAIVTNAALFPVMGAALHGAFKGAGKLFEGNLAKLPENFVVAMKQLNEKQAKAVAAKAAKIAEDITPPAASADAVEFAHNQAVMEALGPITEKQYEEELAAITPKPTAPVNEEVAARARVEAARTTPFPEVQPAPVVDPIEAKLAEMKARVARGETVQERPVLAEPPTPNDVFTANEQDVQDVLAEAKKQKRTLGLSTPEDAEAWLSRDPLSIANHYLDRAKGSYKKAVKALDEAGSVIEIASASEGDDFWKKRSISMQARGALAALKGEAAPDGPLFELGYKKALGELEGRHVPEPIEPPDLTESEKDWGRQYNSTTEELLGLAKKVANREAWLKTQDRGTEIQFEQLHKVQQIKSFLIRRKVPDATIEEAFKPELKYTEPPADIPPRIPTATAPVTETISAPAYQSEDGRVFTGALHVLAHDAAREAGALEIGVGIGRGRDGFLTSLGRFVSRSEASRIAETAGIVGEDAAKVIRKRAQLGGGLDALDIPTDQRVKVEAREVVPSDEPSAAMQNVMAEAVDNPGPVAEAAVADVALTEAVDRTPIKDMADQVTKDKIEEVAASEASVAATKEPNFLDLYGGDEVAGVTHKALEADNVDPIVEAVQETLKGGVEEIKPTWQDVVSNTQPDGGPWNILAKMTEDQLNSVEKAVQRFGLDETGANTAKVAARLAAGSGAGMLEMASMSEDDPRKKSELRLAAGFLGLVSVMPGEGMKKMLAETKFTRRIVKWFALDRVMGKGTKEALQTWQGLVTGGRTMAKLAEIQLRGVFKDAASKDAFMHVLDKGQTAPEWLLLSPEQQKEALSHHLLNLNLGQLLNSLGALDEFKESYMRDMLPKDTFFAWKEMRRLLSKSGNEEAVAKFEQLTEIEAWAKATNREGPRMDPSFVQAAHINEAYRVIATNRTQDLLDRIGLIQSFNPLTATPAGWRKINVLKFSGKIAPDEVASLLERMSPGSGKFGAFDDAFKALDQTKAVFMRTIMLWAWEHGINVARAGLAIDGTGLSYIKALSAVKRANPALLEAASHGLDLFQRPDFGPRGQGIFDKVLAKIGANVPLAKTAGHVIENLYTRGERALWDRWVPSVGFAAYTKYMRDWVTRTGGKYLIGSPEYVAAARAAAKFGNTAMGKVPELVQDPAAQYLMRQALFSPSWLRTRMAITAHAAGDLLKIAAGELNPRDATYLKYKLRSVLLGIGATYALSKIFSGKDPKFNPNSSKFYARTGIHDNKGRELGLDMIGWWQDDVKLFSDPFSFFRDRQNPFIRTGQAVLTGRDQFGQEVVGLDRLENVLLSFGPGAEGLKSVFSGKAPIKSSETSATGYRLTAAGLKDASGLFAVGNVATLPTPMDAAMSKVATKILRINGLPQNDDRVFELSRLLRQNFVQTGGDLVGENVVSWIGFQKQSYKEKKTLGPLWNDVRRAFKHMNRD